MPQDHDNPDVTKKSADRSINSDLVRQPPEHQKWREENREAIETYNRRIESNGTFSDGLRTF